MHGQLPRASTCPMFVHRVELATTVSNNDRQKFGDKKRGEEWVGTSHLSTAGFPAGALLDPPVSQLGLFLEVFTWGGITSTCRFPS